MLRQKKFTFPKGCNANEIVIRETNGFDEQKAAMYADTRGERSNTYQELIRLAIVSVDGKKVAQPFVGLDEWNSKTRALVRNAFDSLNDLSEDEVTDFLLGAETLAVTEPKDEIGERKGRNRKQAAT